MKLNWFSHLPPAKTEIAEYTKRILPSLSKNADLILWTEQEFWDTELEDFAEVYNYHANTVPWDIINEGDLNIYHIDNNPNFQRSIEEISRECPGLVVLHEINVDNLFSAIYFNINRDLTTLALENAAGVIVHSQRYYNLLKEDKTRLTGYIPLPYFLDAPDYDLKISQLGQDLSEQNHQLENYAKIMIDFAEMTKNYRRFPLSNQLVEKVVKEASLLSNLQSLETSFRTVANAIHFLIS